MNFILNPVVTYVAILLFVASSLYILYLKLQLKNIIDFYQEHLKGFKEDSAETLDQMALIVKNQETRIEELQKSLDTETHKNSLNEHYKNLCKNKSDVYLDKLNRILGLVVNNQNYERRLLSDAVKTDYNQEQLDKRITAIKSLITRIKNLASVNQYVSTSEMFFMKNLLVVVDKYKTGNVEDLSAQIQEIIELEELFPPQVSASEDDF